MPKEYCGYISIIGKPNVGKSTILNAILEKKVSITSRKSQTTRNNILGVKTHKNKLLPFLEMVASIHTFQEIMLVSAKTRDGIDQLISVIKENNPENAHIY